MNDLQTTVQNNCHISDAQYAGNYTLCIYLLKMREFYRWEKQQPFGEAIPNDLIGPWLTERETLWDTMEDNEYSPVIVGGEKINPFETRRINQHLTAENLVYSGGYGLYGKPVFFLAELVHQQNYDDYSLYVSATELARDLAAPPGMALDKCVFIRRESLRRYIWEKFEESQWHKNESALSRALACYDFKNKPEDAVEFMTNNEVDTVLQHEIGEIKAGQLLGESWEQMLADLPRSQAELMARAIRDNIADSLSTLPQLIRNAEPAQIHFYFANLSSMSKLIFPSLLDTYQQWLKNSDLSPMKKLINKAEKHWLGIGQSILELHSQHGEESAPYMESLIKSNYL
ncbi:MAG: hypothetical protein OQL06_01220 [Gammaproteobacteria bacterium]|nr:hypothetical protein [Gammaproteobacteria bacterium]